MQYIHITVSVTEQCISPKYTFYKSLRTIVWSQYKVALAIEIMLGQR